VQRVRKQRGCERGLIVKRQLPNIALLAIPDNTSLGASLIALCCLHALGALGVGVDHLEKRLELKRQI
jgi:hypothetical protein